MSRLGKYLKPGKRATAPCILFSVVVDPEIHSGSFRESDTYHSWGGADVCVTKWRRGKWSSVIGARCETPEALADWMASHALRSGKNYVVSPDAAGSLATAGIWDVIDSEPVVWLTPNSPAAPRAAPISASYGTVIRRVAISPRVTILDYTRRALRWVWLSAGQFFAADEESSAAAFGHRWDTEPRAPQPGQTIHRFAKERSVLWSRAFQTLCSWWRETAKAPFGLTASSLSMGILRTHIRAKTLCTHSHEWAHRLERDACVGGSARTWYYGDVDHPCEFGTDEVSAPQRSPYGSIDGPITLVDVRSMYPWLLREETFPMSLTSYREDRGPLDPQAYAEACGVIARVTIETEVPEYPMRSGGNIIYPTGRFTTTLTGPELLRLKKDGRVVKCWAMACYRMGKPFGAAAGSLIEMRELAREKGIPAWELLAKSVGNGMGGKLAQSKGMWIEKPKQSAKVRFGEWYESSAKDGAAARYRAIAGCVSKYERDATGAGPYTFAFAYLAAYGRCHMRTIREECPERSVVSMDTDGLWLTAEGLKAIRPRLAGSCSRAGSLHIDRTAAAARFFGPRHYFTPGEWTLAGFSRPVVSANGTRIRDTQRFLPLAGPAGAPPKGYCVRARESTLDIEAHGVRIGADGWVTARRITRRV